MKGGQHMDSRAEGLDARDQLELPRGRGKPTRLGAVICASLITSLTGSLATAATAQASPRAHATASEYNAKISYWFWGESDIPGITKWMQQRISMYEKLHPGVTIDLVPQSNTTIIPSFKLAAESHTGPDIDTQWATLDTLTPAFSGDVTPISSLVPKSDTTHWINTNENTWNNKIYAMPLYLIGVPLVWNKQLFRQAGLNPNVAPATWSQFLADCKALKAHGITPIGMGNQDGYFGAWMFAIYFKQELNSLSQLTRGIANDGNAQAEMLKMLTKLYALDQSLVKDGYVNSNVASITLDEGWQLFPEKKAAMSFTTDGNVLAWAKTIGEANIGVARPPIWGTGTLASTYDVTQSSDEFITSWSKNKAADAAFLVWLHQPSNMIALNSETGAFPADNRFPVSDISDPLARELYKLDTTGKSIWLENYLPPQVDSDADLPAGELVFSGAGSPAKAAALWVTQLDEWRTEQLQQFQQFKTWAASSS
jgi:raffinose/stachyose/melibiose transport system substrate-binding protein